MRIESGVALPCWEEAMTLHCLPLDPDFRYRIEGGCSLSLLDVAVYGGQVEIALALGRRRRFVSCRLEPWDLRSCSISGVPLLLATATTSTSSSSGHYNCYFFLSQLHRLLLLRLTAATTSTFSSRCYDNTYLFFSRL